MTVPTRAVDVARFEPGDPPALIRAALSCSWCLQTAKHLTLSEDDIGVAALCDCDECGLQTVILLTWRQAAALAGDRPLGLPDEL
jgi:hypothetical protein